MTTRVQKGGPIFKPVAKPRARPGGDNRHPPGSQSQHGQTAIGSSSSQAPSSAMPPPMTLSQPSEMQEILEASPIPGPSSVEHTGEDLQSRSNRPPVIQSRQPPRISQAHPPSIASSSSSDAQPRPIPIAVPTVQQPVISSAVPATQSAPEPSPSVHFPINEADLPATSALAPESEPLAPALQPAAIAPEVIPIPENLSFDHSQIDPALLEAMVTALQHVEQSAHSAPEPPTTNFPQDLPIAPGSDANNGQQTLQQQTRTEATDPQASTSTADPATAGPRPRRKRTKRVVASDEEAYTEDGAQAEAQAGSSTPLKPRKQRKRKRTGSTTGQSEGGDTSAAEGSATTPRRRRKSTAKRKTKSPPPSYDAEADPGEEIDPTSITMGTLCDDPGRGRVSSKAAQIVSNHAAWRATNREKRARMRAVMEAKKYGRNLDEEEDNAAAQATKQSSTPTPEDAPAEIIEGAEFSEAGPSSTTNVGSDDEQEKRDRFDYNQAMSTSRYNVQVRIGPNGETIIDEDSLFVDNNEEDDTAAYTHVEESDSSKFINSSTYSKKARGSRWSAEETELFFDALSQFGENYELISFILPGRDRKACKNKFKAEDKRDPARITFCLKNRRPYDIATLSRMTGKDFSGPTPVIRTPTPVVQPQPDATATASTSTATATKPTSKRKKKAAKTDDVEVLGNLSDMEDDEAVDLAIAHGLNF
ncbi:Transcription factor TFIIIB component B [Steccherinum ochraceum]|uniref:Transcription factor TFIIIB component B n=1 Tax=Steccherinum ochraceum TaxID=92696 RepID=A0A4R0RVX7_9APHY|nr:Transcription factor TFIIIB component B [Steccherinum ochraceum]